MGSSAEWGGVRQDPEAGKAHSKHTHTHTYTITVNLSMMQVFLDSENVINVSNFEDMC